MHMRSSHFRSDQEQDGVNEEGVEVQVKRRTVHECAKCGETYRKLPTLMLHMREDHTDTEEHTGVEEQQVMEQVQKVDVQMNEIEKEMVGQKMVSEDELKDARNKEEQEADQHKSPESAVVVELLMNDKVEKSITAADDDMIQKLKQEVGEEYCEDDEEDDEDELIEDVSSQCGLDMVLPTELKNHVVLRHPEVQVEELVEEDKNAEEDD